MTGLCDDDDMTGMTGLCDDELDAGDVSVSPLLCDASADPASIPGSVPLHTALTAHCPSLGSGAF